MEGQRESAGFRYGLAAGIATGKATLTLTKALLTSDAAARYSPAKVPQLSKDDLRRLLLLCRQNDELPNTEAGVVSHSDLNLRELLRGRILDDFIQKDRIRRLARHGALTTFIFHGDAKAAARIAKVEPRRCQDWAAEFLEFAADWLTAREDKRRYREAARDADYQRRLAQCEEICGRKSFKGGGCNLNDWTGCKLCPLLAVP